MTRTLALAAGLLFTAVSAGTLAAQSTATTRSNPGSSTMQHAPAVTGARQDSTKMRASTTKTQPVKWTKVQIKEAQQGLAKAGYYKGKPTGSYDRSTRNAIRAYQKANNLPVTGRLDNQLLTKLRST